MLNNLLLSKKNKYILCLTILLIPFSYGIKIILRLDEIKWVEPSGIIATLFLIYYLIVKKRFLHQHTNQIPSNNYDLILIFLLSFLIVLGLSILTNVITETTVSLYDYFRELMKIVLGVSLTYYAYINSFFRENRLIIYNLMFFNCVVQIAFSIFSLLAIKINIPLPGFLIDYLNDYFSRQIAWQFHLPRLAGTFYESPPFGLLMLSCFFLSIIMYKEVKSRSSVLFIILSFFGIVASFSEQILVSVISFILLYSLLGKNYSLAFKMVLIVILNLLIFFLLIPSMKNRITEVSTLGSSYGERLMHLNYALELFLQNTKNFLIGVGPGMYGQHASKVLPFPDTVAPQSIIGELIAETGILGLGFFSCLIGTMLVRVSHSKLLLFILASFFFGASFQATWKWPQSFFFFGFIMGYAKIQKQYETLSFLKIHKSKPS